jgi:uncharacterized protein YjiS (DUF1127 family)
MHKSTELNRPAAFEDAAPRALVAYSDTPLVILQRRSAGNDAVCEDLAISTDEVERRAQCARAANGLGDFATIDAPTSTRQTSHAPDQAARALRSFTIGEIIVVVLQAAGAIARRALARHKQRREARAIYDALRQLDDRTLHDLGFDRSEMTSVAAEVTGEAEPARVRALLTSHTLPW